MNKEKLMILQRPRRLQVAEHQGFGRARVFAKRGVKSALLVLIASAAFAVLAASNATAADGWTVIAQHYPTYLAPNGTARYLLAARNNTLTDASGPITLSAALPPGFSATAMSGSGWACPTPAELVGNATPTCTLAGAVLATGSTARVTLTVRAPPTAASGTNTITVSGGGPAQGTVDDPLIVSDTGGSPGFIPGTVKAGISDHQAGGHPNARVSFRLAVEMARQQFPLLGDLVVVKGGAPKDVVVELPKGLLGNPQAAPQCPAFDLTPPGECPPTSQVGYTDAILLAQGAVSFPVRAAVYNMVPERGEVAKFGFRAQALNAFISVRVSSQREYALTTTVKNIFDGWELAGTDLTIWGVPGDPANDPERHCIGSGVPGRYGVDAQGNVCSSTEIRPKPFMIAPAECGIDGFATVRYRPWTNPTDAGWQIARSVPEQVTGCERQVFRPTINVFSDNTERGQPIGLGVDIEVPDTLDSPYGISTPPLHDASVTLPAGMSISSSSWYGLQGCSDEQLGLGTDEPARCPDGSRIGDVTLKTPVLAETLEGGIYLGTQLSDDPQSGNLFRIAIELVNEDRGLVVKIPGKVFVDPTTGRVTARFRDNPQLPFSKLSLRFKGGARAPLTAPQQCGPATTTATFTGWGVENEPANVDSTFTVTHDGSGAPCPLGFTPSFAAGVVDPVGGKSSTFTLSFGRDDDDADLSGLTVRMPRGLLAKIADVQALCPDARAAAGTCGEASRIGSVQAATGAGPNPPYLPGRVYLTGPYKGQPYGLSIVVPALAGPFDLGTVVVRSAIDINVDTTELTVISDPLPLMLAGVPLRVRNINVDIDRSSFMVNPTNCSPMEVGGTIASADGRSAAVGTRFQASDCASLPFRPKMALKVGAKGRTRVDITTPLTATLTMPQGDANNRSVSVILPKTLNARLTVVNRACTLAEFKAGSSKCIKVGSASAVTPLLRDPLRGSAYFVRNPARRIPDLMVALKGPVNIDLTGMVTIPRDLTLKTEFISPDAPISKFTLKLNPGRSGAVGVVRNLCTKAGRSGRAKLAFRAQSGRLVQREQKLQIAGCGRAARARRGGGRAQSSGSKAKKQSIRR